MHMGRALNIYLDITVMKLRDLKIHNFSNKLFKKTLLNAKHSIHAKYFVFIFNNEI
jgi:hypothetical protein